MVRAKFRRRTGADTPTFLFDGGELEALGAASAENYRGATPFPHAVFDGFLPESVMDALIAEFPKTERPIWNVNTDDGHTKKLSTPNERLMGPVTRQVIAQFNGQAMIEFVEQLTGIEGLVPDPKLFGGGLHLIERGGFLNIHADFNIHPFLQINRRVNALLYLNRHWPEEWGGHLELWPMDMSAAAQRILPVANRLVVLNTTDRSLHGHPEPLKCPSGFARRSLAFYYYSAGRPIEEVSQAHSTLYQEPGVPARGPE